MTKHDIEILNEDDMYKICMLVKHGWKRNIYGHYWIHPEGKLMQHYNKNYHPDYHDSCYEETEEWDLDSAYEEIEED